MEAISNMIQKTNKIFEQNVYLTEASAKIVDVSKNKNGFVTVVLDGTIFHPEEGGQSADSGYIRLEDKAASSGTPSGDAARYAVTGVKNDGGVIVHTLAVREAPLLAPGACVRLSIDWEHRFDNMQRHCGEHILSGVLHKMYGGVNRGFHMGEECMTIDISLEDDAKYAGRPLDIDMLEAAELEANKVIWRDEPVTVSFFPTREGAEQMPLRKKLAIDKDISIVTIGDPSDPSDCVACCGTHPSSTGQVGLIKIFRVMANKGMYRVFFEAGKRAYIACRDDYSSLMHIAKDLSAGRQDAVSKYDSQVQKNSEVRERLYNITGVIKKKEAGEIAKALASGTPVIKYYEFLTSDDISDIGLSLLGGIPSLLILVSRKANTVFLFSDKADCGGIVRERAKEMGGKGGGKKEFARAVFPSGEAARTFAEKAAET
jgi:alanyl-tRNA synthetase